MKIEVRLQNKLIQSKFNHLELNFNLVSHSKCSNYDGSDGFCHNGGSCWVMSNGTSACSCMAGTYGPKCEFTKDQYKPTDGNDRLS